PSSLRYISGVLTKAMKKLGIEKNVKLHAFRKYYATKIVESGATPFETQKLVRHANIQTTISHYYSQDNQKLKEILQKISTI
ncbi:MAG: site-specific integrase, partial [Candidatus Pacearchaeota archaeon]|nr:site-specific integrase [Candidatus Pacearchaeota archaeon]